MKSMKVNDEKRNFFNTKGFSLVQVLVSVGLMGGLALVASQIATHSSNLQISSRAGSDYLELSREVREILSHPRDCLASFEGVSFSAPEIRESPITLELWRADRNRGDDPTPPERAQLKFTSLEDDPRSSYGEIQITSLEFSMPDLSSGETFTPSEESEFQGEVILRGMKRISGGKSREMRPIATNLSMNLFTDSAGLSVVRGCSALGFESSEEEELDDGVLFRAEINEDDCQWIPDAFTSLQEEVNQSCPNDQVIVGVQSNFVAADRKFRFKCCPVESGGARLMTKYRFHSGWVNSYDDVVSFLCPPPLVISGVHSKYHTHYMDRIYSFECSELLLESEARWVRCLETQNQGNGLSVNFSCSGDRVMVGEMSEHDNGINDRTFQFTCCGIETR